MKRKHNILATAYAVNPYKGSEDGMGWNMILQIAAHQRVIAITRKNNREAIERYLSENRVREANNIQFAYFDLPYYLRFWKKGGRGALLYFYLWQIGVAFWILSKNWKYDLVHNLNFHNDWTPSFLWLTGKPLVWGPIGHHPTIPKPFLVPYGSRAIRRHRLRWWTKQWFWHFSPWLKLTKRKAKHIFAMNEEVIDTLQLDTFKTTILPSVGCEHPRLVEHSPQEEFTVLSVGRFVSLKGFDLTIKAFATFFRQLSPDQQALTRLKLVGRGPELEQIREWVAQEGIGGVTEIIPWVERSQLGLIYQSANLFLFPSHEGAGMVVAEALSYGLPVVCLDNCGPGAFINASCGRKVVYQDYAATVNDLGQELFALYLDRNLRQRLSNGAKRHFYQRFRWTVKGTIFHEVYNSLLISEPVIPTPEMPQASSV